MTWTRTIAMGFALAVCVVAAGCGGGGNPSPTPSPSPGPSASVSVYHLLVANGLATEEIDSTVNGAPLNSRDFYTGGVSDRTVSWNAASPELTFRFLPAGLAEPVLFQSTRTLDSGASYTGLFVGMTVPPTPAQGPDLLLLARSRAAIAPGKVRVRFVHALPDSGAYDFFVGPTGVERKIVSVLSFKQVSEWIEIDAPTDFVSQRVTITTPGGAPGTDIVVNIPITYSILNWEPRRAYTVVLVHRTADTSSRITQLLIAE